MRINLEKIAPQLQHPHRHPHQERVKAVSIALLWIRERGTLDAARPAHAQAAVLVSASSLGVSQYCITDQHIRQVSCPEIDYRLLVVASMLLGPR